MILLIIGLIVGSSISLNLMLTKPKYPCTQEYIPGTGNIKGEVNIKSYLLISKDFEICANKYGMAVFKNPNKALKTLKKNYAEGIKLIKKEYHLMPLTQLNYKEYGTFGWQTTTGTNEESNQAMFVSSFMDIYENSYSLDG